jgi:lysophospholipase L1-like esterase
MSTRRVAAAAMAVLSTTAVLAGNVALPAPAQAATNGAMVAFGDSVPSGAVCHCQPFPQRYAHEVAVHTGRAVHMTNDAFGGARSADVVAQLDDKTVRKAVSGAGTALVMIGANDFGPAFREVLAHKARARKVFPPVASQVRSNVIAIVRRLHRIRPGIRVIVADYWGVMKDGAVGRRTYGAWGMRKADRATADANAALRNAATTTHATYVSTYRAFKGPNGTTDPTPLLASDGDHPNSRGHGVIAQAFFAAAPNG